MNVLWGILCIVGAFVALAAVLAAIFFGCSLIGRWYGQRYGAHAERKIWRHATMVAVAGLVITCACLWLNDAGIGQVVLWLCVYLLAVVAFTRPLDEVLVATANDYIQQQR